MRKLEAGEGGNTMATEGDTFFPKVSAIDAERSVEALEAEIRGGRLRPGAVVVSMSTKEDCASTRRASTKHVKTANITHKLGNKLEQLGTS